jgi:hypothetical protein
MPFIIQLFESNCRRRPALQNSGYDGFSFFRAVPKFYGLSHWKAYSALSRR